MISAEAILISLCRNLILTLAIELGVMIILHQPCKNIILCFWLNIFTNPLIGLALDIFYISSNIRPELYIIIPLEIFAVVFEGYFYSRIARENIIKCYILSLVLNMISFTGGILI